MSKLWLLLLLVAAFQAVHSYPAPETDYLEDSTQSTWSILKEAWDKLKDKYTEMGKEKLQQAIDQLKDKLCTQQDFEEDFDFEEDEEPSLQNKVLQKLKELNEKVKMAVGEKKEQLKQEIEKLRSRICDKLNDYEEDPAESTWSILKEAWDKLKNKYEEMGKEKLQNLIIKLREKICNEKNLEEDFDFESDEEKEPSRLEQIIQKLKELLEKAKAAAGEEKEKIKQQINAIRAKICDKLNNDVEEEEEEDYEEDTESTWSIIKDTWGKLKDKYTEMGKKQLQAVIAKLKDKICTEQDFEENTDFAESDEEKELTLQNKILQQYWDLLKKFKTAAGEEKEKLKKKIDAFKAKICDKLNDYEEEEEVELQEYEEDSESTWGILKDTFGKLKDRWSSVTKEKMKKVVSFLKNKFCAQENDFEEDDAESEKEQGGIMGKYKLVKKMQELWEKAKEKYGNEKEKLNEALKEIRAKFCAKL